LLAGVAIALAGCGEEGGMGFLSRSAEEAPAEAEVSRSVRLVERDVEAPEVFQVTEAGLWDGRPSLGGVWVAHPEVGEPERVIIRNTANGSFVIGALFRREREVPGPRLQVSSDAAGALGLLAGQPQRLEVTALRREEVTEGPEEGAETDGAQATEALPAAAEITETPLEPVEAAARAIEAEAEPQPAAARAEPEPAPTPAPRASGLARPYVQIGIFSIEENARNTATAMRQAGMVPTVREQSSQGKTFWRVLVGPAPNQRDLAALLDKARDQGFADAYAVRD
jgi:cell division septation protein DedD